MKRKIKLDALNTKRFCIMRRVQIAPHAARRVKHLHTESTRMRKTRLALFRSAAGGDCIGNLQTDAFYVSPSCSNMRFPLAMRRFPFALEILLSAFTHVRHFFAKNAQIAIRNCGRS